MFSKPKLGVNTAVYHESSLSDAVENIKALGVDGVVLKWRNRFEIIQASEYLTPLKLFGIELPYYQIGTSETLFETVLQTAVKLASPTVILPSPEAKRPFEKDKAAQFVAACRQFAQMAARNLIDVVVPVTNRFDNNILNTIAQAEQFLERVDHPNVKLSLGTFDMNIEEQDGAGKVRALEQHLAFLRMADSNFGAIGEGHIKLGAYLWAIQELEKEVPILLEVKRPFDSPFAPESQKKSTQELLEQSRSWF